MEAKNLLKRTYGGAVLPDTLHPGHTNLVSTRKDKNIKQKQENCKKSSEINSSWRYDLSWIPRQQTLNWQKKSQKQELEITVDKLYDGYCIQYFAANKESKIYFVRRRI